MPRIVDAGKPMHVDMVDRGRRIVVEYDGAYWHKGAAKVALDRNKNDRLARAGWTVIRVRETPLALLNPDQDVQVTAPDGDFAPMIEAVLKHLQSLILNGVVPDDGLSAKVWAALQAPIDGAVFRQILGIGFASYAEASAWAQQENIKSARAWLKRMHGRPSNIPTDPVRFYGSEWKGWGAFLGTGFVSTWHRTFRPFAAVSAWAQQEGITSLRGWQARMRREDVPDDIPVHPSRSYKSEWQGWNAFLGTSKARRGRSKHQRRPIPYVINLTKAKDAPAQNDVAFDPAFVMPWAA